MSRRDRSLMWGGKLTQPSPNVQESVKTQHVEQKNNTVSTFVGNGFVKGLNADKPGGRRMLAYTPDVNKYCGEPYDEKAYPDRDER